MIRVGFEAKRAFANRTGLGNYSRQLILSLLEFCPELQLYLFSPNLEIKDWGYEKFDHSHLITNQSVLSALWRLWTQTRENEFKNLDVYHGLSHELPISSRSKTKWVVTIHDLIFLHYPELYTFPDRLIYELKFKHACHKADKIVAVSQQTANDLINFWKVPQEKIQVIYQSCHPSYWAPINQGQLDSVKLKYNLPNEFLLSVGTLEPRKNVLSILKSMLISKHDLPLYIVGDGGDYKKELLEFVSRNKLENKVYFLGRAPFEDLSSLYRLATLFVYPSFFEGFGIPLIEALFSGTPVISSKGPCLCFKEAAGPGGRYIDPNSSEDLAQTIDEVVFNDKLREEMIIDGQNYVRKFLPEKVAQEWNGLYQQLVSG